MMLAAKSCTPCRGGEPRLSPQEAKNFLEDAPGWNLEANATKIEKTFKFKNFSEALRFVNKVADLSEDQGHHPDITFGWGYCTVVLFTHKIKGLHENDFIMAAKINNLAQKAAPESS
jgi:4a-hydroxytetrahydrobiopterin dehydratase